MLERRVVVYKRTDELFEWQLVAENGEIVATSGNQGYSERNDAIEAAEREFPDYPISIDGVDD
jgi:uncharacterized protein YegP (UPF0339 family)